MYEVVHSMRICFQYQIYRTPTALLSRNQDLLEIADFATPKQEQDPIGMTHHLTYVNMLHVYE